MNSIFGMFGFEEKTIKIHIQYIQLRLFQGKWKEFQTISATIKAYALNHDLSFGLLQVNLFQGPGTCLAVFLPTLVMGNFMVLNLFLALLLNSFNSEELKTRKEVFDAYLAAIFYFCMDL